MNLAPTFFSPWMVARIWGLDFALALGFDLQEPKLEK